jgi:succinyl-CoA synthetase beta subunit
LERLQGAGLSGWESITATDEEAAVVAAGRVGYPVAMKWEGNIAHRARIGGVALGLKNEGAIREAWRSLTSRATELHIDYEGLVVQAMVEGGLELFVGGVRDQQFGPIVLFGLGGIRVEEAGQVAVALAPTSRPDAELLVDASPCAEVIGQRQEGGLLDRDAVVDAVMAVAELISDAAVLAIDVNPLIALPHGVAVVDCKIVVAGSPSTEDETAVSRDVVPAGTSPHDKAMFP